MTEEPTEVPVEGSDDDSRPTETATDAAASTDVPAKAREYRPLRVWPVPVFLIGLWVFRLIPVLSAENSMPVMMLGFMGPMLFAALVGLWWLCLSRARLSERVVGFFGLIVLGVVTNLAADKTVQGIGVLGYAVPWGVTGFGLAAFGMAGVASFRRTWFALLAALLCFGFWTTVRTDAIWGNFRTARSWRWEPTTEEQFLRSIATRSPQPGLRAAADVPLAEPEWPAFRGPHRDGVQPGVVLDEDWQAHPPKQRWRTRVGPGWSSFSVAGDRLFTQEQRGENEAIVCYQASSGQELWSHTYPSRFWETVGGAGPRATPTLHGGNLYALGAAGLLHRLDAATGRPVWQRDITKDAGRQPPEWGFASSPLVTNGVAIVHAGGSGDRGVLAYDVETGDLRWSSPAGDHGYSSAQLSTIGGTPCVLMLTNKGLTCIEPATGRLLGKHDWEFGGYRVLQPLVLDDSSVLLATSMGTGTKRISVSKEGEALTMREQWLSRMSPTFNDFVAHDGYLYGFDNNIFACIDLADGARKWKQGRYGNGQVLLLPDGDQLLVLSEGGEIVLLRATPEEWIEVARQQVLEGRTWNHPVLVGDRLYVRNGEEAACFEMPLHRLP